MSSPKTRVQWGLMAKVESTYGTAVALTGANDGILTSDFPECDFKGFLFNGDRGQLPLGARNISAAMAGRIGKISAPAHMIGGGAAYSASVVPSLHTLLRACGMDPTSSFTGGSEKYQYGFESGPTGLDSVTMEAYVEGQLFSLFGGYGDFSIECEGAGIPVWSFDFLGIGNAPTDVAIPAITYPALTRIPPRCDTIMTLGLYTAAVVNHWSFSANRNVDTPRVQQNAAGHVGYTPERAKPTLEVTIEKQTLTAGAPFSAAGTFNPYRIMDSGQLMIASLQCGSTQYNRWKLWSGGVAAAAAQAQIIDVDEDKDGPRGLWKLTLAFTPSSPILQDDVTITLD